METIKGTFDPVDHGAALCFPGSNFRSLHYKSVYHFARRIYDLKKWYSLLLLGKVFQGL